MPLFRSTAAVFGTATFVATLALPLAAQDAGPEPGWSFEGELSTVLTEGNSSAFTLGLGATLTRVWENAQWKLEASGIQTESGTITRTAVGSTDAFEVVTDTERRTTAESYALKTRYDRDLSDASFVYGATDWLRNTFAGIESRVVLGLGAGRTFRNDDVARLKAGLGATFTFENDVVSSGAGDHPGLRGNYEYWRQLTESTQFESALTADVNLDDTDDVRLEWENSVSVDISSVLALKPSLQLQWRNQPSLTEVPLLTPGGADTGVVVLAPLETLDTQFRLALVLTL